MFSVSIICHAFAFLEMLPPGNMDRPLQIRVLEAEDDEGEGGKLCSDCLAAPIGC